MPVLNLEFEVYCSCGAGLCLQTTEGRTPGRGMPFVTVEPCGECMDAAREEAREEGHSEGYDQGCEDMKEEA